MTGVYDFRLLVLGPLAMLAVLMLRRFLNLDERLPRWSRALSWLWVPAGVGFAFTFAVHYRTAWLSEAYILFAYGAVLATLLRLGNNRPARTLALGVLPLLLRSLVKLGLVVQDIKLVEPYAAYFNSWNKFAVIFLIAMCFVARYQRRLLLKEQQQREEEEQARQLIATHNAELEHLVAERTAALTQQATELREALAELKIKQGQLIQAEKMASLGELTAGIAHEIQNPLNFVNNFSEVSAELLDELAEAQAQPTPDAELETELLSDLTQNLQKITQHGQRASRIVRGMLEHSRASSGERTLTDVNALCEEYLRLAYHGLRAKDKRFNATLETDLAPVLPLVEAVSQDVGRVLLNLFTNAFYAVQQRQLAGEPGYLPTVRVSTVRAGDAVEVRVRDNGMGMPEAVKARIFQPFFTTKPSGEGTGLGLSLSYDIVVQGHGGTLAVESQPGEFTEFVVQIPFRASD